MRCLGLIMDDAEISTQVRQAYIALFAKPLSEEHLQAIKDLFPSHSLLLEDPAPSREAQLH